jgi:hypothetical protein
MLQKEVDNEPGDAYHIMNRSTVLIDKGYHPAAWLPGYEMYYFTILGGQSQRSLKQFFQPTHAAQVQTIPGDHGHGGQVQMTAGNPERDVLRPALSAAMPFRAWSVWDGRTCAPMSPPPRPSGRRSSCRPGRAVARTYAAAGAWRDVPPSGRGRLGPRRGAS